MSQKSQGAIAVVGIDIGKNSSGARYRFAIDNPRRRGLSRERRAACPVGEQILLRQDHLGYEKSGSVHRRLATSLRDGHTSGVYPQVTSQRDRCFHLI
jgi:hypothetical protein